MKIMQKIHVFLLIVFLFACFLLLFLLTVRNSRYTLVLLGKRFKIINITITFCLYLIGTIDIYVVYIC